MIVPALVLSFTEEKLISALSYLLELLRRQLLRLGGPALQLPFHLLPLL